jgi:hypothetical protein
MAQVPTPPFFFRILSSNGQGIVYRADRHNGDSYMCTGSRQIGQAGPAIIWEVGGYADAMPRESMHTIMGNPKPMSKAQTNAFVDANGLAAKYKQMSLYTDGGYWFAEKSKIPSRTPFRSRSRSPSRSPIRSPIRSPFRSRSRSRSRNQNGSRAARSLNKTRNSARSRNQNGSRAKGKRK